MGVADVKIPDLFPWEGFGPPPLAKLPDAVFAGAGKLPDLADPNLHRPVHALAAIRWTVAKKLRCS